MNFIRNLIKSTPEKRNIYHGDFRNKIEPAFKLDQQYYRFKDQADTPHLRNFYKDYYVDQYRKGMDFESLDEYLAKIQEQIDKGKLGDASYTTRALRERINANQSLDLLYKIATVCYFTEDEYLEGFSISDNREKLQKFRESKDLSFFLTNPMTDIFPLLSSFVSDSEVFLSRVQVAKELTSEIDSLFLHPSDKG
jgi:hypothetical protein